MTTNDDINKTIARQPQAPVGASGERQACLIVISGAEIGRTHRIEAKSTDIGRAPDNGIVLEEDGVSRIHARLFHDEERRVSIQDCGSTNGTLVNGKAVNQDAILLKDGDKVQIGGAIILKFSYQDQLDENFQQKLFASAVRDGLTGVYNKRYGKDRLEQEFALAVRADVPLSLAVVDLDHFKRVNDDHGHTAGDEVLRAVSQRLQDTVRAGDMVCRWGGEEFVVVMRECGLEEAMAGAERLRESIAASPISTSDTSLPITASIGVACTKGATFETPGALFKAADRALYASKALGRNRVSAPGKSTN